MSKDIELQAIVDAAFYFLVEASSVSGVAQAGFVYIAFLVYDTK